MVTVVPDGNGAAGELEKQIGQWRDYLRRRRAISSFDVSELEDHLREQVADLERVGLSGDEAFLVAVKRLGSLDAVSREFAREHSERLWRQLVLDPGVDGAGKEGGPGHELAVVLGLATASALAIKVPALIGLDLDDDAGFYARNLSLFVLPFLAGYFAWKRGMQRSAALRLLVPPFVVAAVLANVYPFAAGGSTQVLVAIHLPVALWITVGVAYLGGEWRAPRPRMDFIRFTGEWAIYYTLLALGGGVLTALTAAGFEALDLDVSAVISEWLLPCGAMGAVLVAARLVEAKQSVVENMAPVLTRVFTPLTTVMLLALLAATIATGDVVEVDRDLLILVDVILVLVFGLLLYAISARDTQAPPGTFDRLQLLLVLSALAVDLLMLTAMLTRIAEFGASPNKIAALGLNLTLLANLAWSARLSLGFLRRHTAFTAIEDWQTRYLPVFAGWAALVVAVFPPAFGFA
jgi:hypothetical protein